MFGRRELRPLLLVALLGVALACGVTLGGLHGPLLHLAPALVLLLPLLAGRYLGEDRIAALAGAVRRRRRARVRAFVALPRRRPFALVARGGLLLAEALAERGPPAVLGTR